MIKRIKPILILNFIIFCFVTSLKGQNNSLFTQNPKIDTNDLNILYLKVNNLNFFKDNEFKAEKVSGYTLPWFSFKS